MRSSPLSSFRPWQILILLLVFIALSSAAYSYFGILKVAKFRDQSIARKFEGSLSEDLGFLTVLTTEASKAWDSEKDQEVELIVAREIRTMMDGIREQLESVFGTGEQERNGEGVTRPIEEMGFEELVALMAAPLPEALPIEQLNLVAVVPEKESPTPRPSLESEPRKDASSFVFVPSPLVTSGVSSGDRIHLSKPIANEIAFSKLVVDEVLKRKDELIEKDIFQVYFVPSSGLARLAHLELQDQGEAYRGHFSPVRSFSDRTYFGKTHDSEQPFRFRETEPYLDVAGGGLIKTYTAFVKNEALGVYGLIGFDRSLGELEPLWETNFGTAPLLRDFHMISYLEGDPPPAGASDEVEWAIGYIREHLDDCKAGIRRLPSPKGKGDSPEETIFTVPMGKAGPESASKAKFAIFVFDAEMVASKYNFLLILFVLSSVGVGLIALIANRENAAREVLEKGKAEAERLYKDVVKHLHGGFALVDHLNTILAANPKFSKIVGDDDPVGKKIGDFLTPESMAALENHKEEEKESLLNDGEAGFEFPATIKDAEGSTSPTILSSAPIELEAGEEARVLILLPSEELEITIGSKFLHSFSHALKTPAHSIMLLSETFRKRKNQPKFDYYCWLMEKEIDEFSGLVKNILEFSELELQDVRLKLESVNLARMLRGLAKVAKKRAEKKGLIFFENIPEVAHCEVDQNMIRIVFNNLIDNALKYTDTGFIFIRLTEDQDQVEIAFHDSGVGVDEKDRSKIFDIFFRSESKKVRAKEGIGIGLHVSKRYVRLLGGTLEYHPLPPEKMKEDAISIENTQGSVFVITLPKRRRRSDPGEPEIRDMGG